MFAHIPLSQAALDAQNPPSEELTWQLVGCDSFTSPGVPHDGISSADFIVHISPLWFPMSTNGSQDRNG